MQDMHDLNFLAEALPQMQEYLLSKELYWPLSATLPRLTPGAVMFALLRLKSVSPTEAEKALEDLNLIRAKWRTAWESKVLREITNRHRLWANYLSDCVNNPEQNGDSYASEVRGRTILQLLATELPGFPEKSSLVELDSLLKTKLIPTDFLWGTDLQPAFPKETFWFLYGKI